MTAAPQDGPLPPLPEPETYRIAFNDGPARIMKYYTVEQVRDYARAARAPLLQEIERLKVMRPVPNEGKSNAAYHAQRAEKAEARLAVAEALLKEARFYVEMMQDRPQDFDLLERIDAFLKEQK